MNKIKNILNNGPWIKGVKEFSKSNKSPSNQAFYLARKPKAFFSPFNAIEGTRRLE